MNQLKRHYHYSPGTVLDVDVFRLAKRWRTPSSQYLHASIIPHGGRIFPVSLSRTLSYPGSAREYLTGKNRSVEIMLVRKPKEGTCIG